MVEVKSINVYVLADDYAGYSSLFIAQHGASYLVEVENSNGNICRIIFDTATYGELVLRNMGLLNIDPKIVDAIILSHCHYDHTRGLIEVVKSIGKDDLPIIAHPMIFRPHFILKPKMIHVGMPKGYREEAEEHGARWILVNKPTEIAENIMITGEVERRVNFEKTPTIKLYTLSNGALVPDELIDDMSLVISTPEGLVIVTGCSHAGIINILKKAMKITGNKSIKAVIGGLHLIDADEDRIRKTIEYLVRLNVKELYVGHCTGFKAECELLRAFAEKFKKLHAGMKITL